MAISTLGPSNATVGNPLGLNPGIRGNPIQGAQTLRPVNQLTPGLPPPVQTPQIQPPYQPQSSTGIVNQQQGAQGGGPQPIQQSGNTLATAPLNAPPPNVPPLPYSLNLPTQQTQPIQGIFPPTPGYPNNPGDIQSQILGPYANLFPPNFTRGEVPLIQFRQQADARALAEARAQQALNVLGGGRGAIGSSPETALALKIAMDRAGGGGPFTPQIQEEQRGNIIDQGAVGLRDALQTLAASYGARGMGGGSASAADQARLVQQGALGTQGQLSNFNMQARLANEEAGRAALAQLMGLQQQTEQGRSAFDQAIAQLMASSQPGQIDLSSLLAGIDSPSYMPGSYGG